MKTDKPFQKTFICAGLLFATIAVILATTGEPNASYRIGRVLGQCLFPALITSFWGFFSKKHWSWGRFVATFIGLYLLCGLIIISGKMPR